MTNGGGEEKLEFFLGEVNASHECRLEAADIIALSDAENNSALTFVVRVLLKHEDSPGMISGNLTSGHG